MNRERFRGLVRYLRFDDKETREQRKITDNLAAINEVYDPVVNNFTRLYTPRSNLTVDEVLIRFKGNFFARLLMKSKPGKYGIEVWSVADSYSRYTTKMTRLQLLF